MSRSLAQLQRLTLARRLLSETSRSVTSVAYAAGFQSLRRFNSVFQQRFGISPSALRREVPAEFLTANTK
ncbi:MAG: helix-turn-helix domain-containing protein [Gemmatimonadaceae bacterium]